MMEAVPDAAGLGGGRQAQPLRRRRLRRPGHLRPAQGGARRPGRGRSGRPGNRTYYLATVPAMFDDVAPGLGAVGLNRPRSRTAAVRLVDREAVRPRPRQRPPARRRPARDLRRVADLPHRPLPRQGDGPERPGPALRQRHLRAALEPPLHRPRPDHRGRVARRGEARRLLRTGRRPPRHRAEPRHAGAVAHPHGAARLHRRPGHPRREGQGAAVGGHPDPRRGAHRRGAGPVRQRLERGDGGARPTARRRTSTRTARPRPTWP